MIWQFLSWYLVIQLMTVAALPLALRLFANLADHGYAFSKSLGILLVGLVLWLGTSYGLLRNETGGAWLALALVAVISFTLGRQTLRSIRLTDGRFEFAAEEALSGPAHSPFTVHHSQFTIRYVFVVELLFLFAFAAWAYVRAYDPAANHTEKPMDLMFMNSIWTSPTYPPQDAWLSGYAISYYYFGYWLVTTVGRLAGQPPEIAYAVGQASWFGLLLIGCGGVGYNLLRQAGRGEGTAIAGGLLAAVAVGVTGNAQVILEWLYANGVDVTPLARWFAVDGFPDQAVQSGNWFIGFDWWWWRSSRVLEDLSLTGGHIEVIDEFPIFSYVLGDNHPHVLGMPFVLLVIGLAQNLFFGGRPVVPAPVPFAAAGADARLMESVRWHVATVASAIPLGGIGALLLAVGTGALVFLNTWDFPPYWLLVVVCLFVVLLRAHPSCLSTPRAALLAAIAGGGLLAATAVVYLPYFLTAQSQAGGFVPNFFNPTRFPQLLLMFGFGLFGSSALLGLAWPLARPTTKVLGLSAAILYGGPLIFLAVSLLVAFGTERGQELLRTMTLPAGSSSHWPFIVERWSRQGWSFLIIGGLLTVAGAQLWQLTGAARETPPNEQRARQATLFALLLSALGLLLVYAPEFVFLRDNFGSRMNTIFKFYYQAWLLLGLGATYAIVEAISHRRKVPIGVTGLSLLALALIAGGLLYPVAASYSKTHGFATTTPTFDAIAYVGQENPAELAAIYWIQANTPAGSVVVQGLGRPYQAHTARISAATGRPTLLGWDGHESQWRGKAYGTMAGGRAEALDLIYRSGSPEQIRQVLEQYGIDYVYVGRTERSQYEMTPLAEERLARVMDLVFEQGDVRIYQRRGG